MLFHASIYNYHKISVAKHNITINNHTIIKHVERRDFNVYSNKFDSGISIHKWGLM